MIERIEIRGWGGIERGELSGLAQLTLFSCADADCRRALLAALGFLRINEQDAGHYDHLWRRSRPITAATLPRLVPTGQAEILGRVDGRPVRINLRMVNHLELRGEIEGDGDFGLRIEAGEVISTGRLPSGPPTRFRKLLACELPQPGLDFEHMREIAVGFHNQVIAGFPDAASLDDCLRGTTAADWKECAVFDLSLVQGELRVARRAPPTR